MNTFTDRKICMKVNGFLDHNGIKLESNNEVSGKISNIFKLNQKHVSNHESKRKSQEILENILNRKRDTDV